MMLSYDLEALNEASLLPVLSGQSMRDADKRAIDEVGIPGFALMETAGRACARVAQSVVSPPDGEVLIFCGPGNNGGDGYVIARILAMRGFRVRVITEGSPGEGSDAAAHEQLLRRLGGRGVSIVSGSDVLRTGLRTRPSLCIDALLGTGITRDLDGGIADLVDFMNELGAPVLSVDIPTGLHTDTGEILGRCVRATWTVTMAALKKGHLIGDGPAMSGRIHVAEIGIPRDVLTAGVQADDGAMALTDEAIRRWLPRRKADAHKYSAGFVLIIAGGPGMAGAAIMATRAAARSGAGYVACATPASVQSIVSTAVPASTSIALPAIDDGIDAGLALDALSEKLDKADAIVIGPGLGRSDSTLAFVRTLLERWDGKAVIDADALVALADVSLAHFEHRSKWLLTPHAGEFRTMTGSTPAPPERSRAATEFARTNGLTLLLKGNPSIIASADHPPFVATTGHESLATAGTGDVLSGMSGAFLARGLSPEHAGACGLHIGGLAARHLAATRGSAGMIATDLIDVIPDIITSRIDCL
jgi:ADP-dependent NAD(P)H-hydrate dehydratase / NAD(P)H-hydrate epimerase